MTVLMTFVLVIPKTKAFVQYSLWCDVVTLLSARSLLKIGYKSQKESTTNKG